MPRIKYKFSSEKEARELLEMANQDMVWATKYAPPDEGIDPENHVFVIVSYDTTYYGIVHTHTRAAIDSVEVTKKEFLRVLLGKRYVVVRKYSHTDTRNLWKVITRGMRSRVDAELWSDLESKAYFRKNPRAKSRINFFVVEMDTVDLLNIQ